MQTKGGDKAAHAAVPLPLRIANDGRPHLVPAGGVPMPPITAPSAGGAQQKPGRANG